MSSSTKVLPLKETITEKDRQTPKPMTLGAVSDRLFNLHLDLEKVDGTLGTILQVGSAESVGQPSPGEFLNMLQLLADIVSPVCEELEAIMQEIETQAASPTLRQGRRACVKGKEVREPSRR